MPFTFDLDRDLDRPLLELLGSWLTTFFFLLREEDRGNPAAAVRSLVRPRLSDEEFDESEEETGFERCLERASVLAIDLVLGGRSLLAVGCSFF